VASSPDHPPPPHQVHPGWGARPVRRAARAPGGRQPRARCRRRACRAPSGTAAPAARRGARVHARFASCATRRAPPIKAEDVTIGSVFHVMPEGLLGRPGGGVREAHPGGEGQGRRPPHAARPKTSSRARSSATGATRASSPTPRSAPTSAARSGCTSSRPTTCCARATSRPSTSPGLQGHLRPRQAAAAATEDHRRRRGLPRLRRSRSPKRSARASGSVADEHHHRPTRRRPARRRPPPRPLPSASRPSSVGGVAGWVDDRTGAAKGRSATS
jgi:hypothetical protein